MEANLHGALPLQLITIELQGIRHAEVAALVAQLDQVRDRILSGAMAGEESADVFGYRFAVTSPAESVFAEPASYF